MSKRMDTALANDRGTDIAWARLAAKTTTETLDIAVEKLHRRLRPHFEDGIRHQLSQALTDALDMS